MHNLKTVPYLEHMHSQPANATMTSLTVVLKNTVTWKKHSPDLDPVRKRFGLMRPWIERQIWKTQHFFPWLFSEHLKKQFKDCTFSIKLCNSILILYIFQNIMVQLLAALTYFDCICKGIAANILNMFCCYPFESFSLSVAVQLRYSLIKWNYDIRTRFHVREGGEGDGMIMGSGFLLNFG